MLPINSAMVRSLFSESFKLVRPKPDYMKRKIWAKELTILDGATAEEFPFIELGRSAQILQIRTDVDVTLTLNYLGTAVEEQTKRSRTLYAGSSVTIDPAYAMRIHIANNSGGTATVQLTGLPRPTQVEVIE